MAEAAIAAWCKPEPWVCVTLEKYPPRCISYTAVRFCLCTNRPFSQRPQGDLPAHSMPASRTGKRAYGAQSNFHMHRIRLIQNI